MNFLGVAQQARSVDRTRWRWSALGRAVLLGLALSLAGSATAWAQPSAADKETARSLMDDGDRKFGARDFQGALKAYSAAHSLMGVPTTGLEVAKAQEAMGLLVEARDTALAVSRMPQTNNEPAAFVKAKERAREIASRLAARIPSLTVQVGGLSEGETPSVTIDGAAIPAAAVGVARKVNPGTHVLVVTAPGYAEARQEIKLEEAGEKVVRVDLAKAGGGVAAVPVPPPASAPLGEQTPPPATPAPYSPSGADGGTRTSTLTYIGFGIGGVGIAAGAITGALAFSKAGKAKDQCPNNVCPPAAQSDIDSSKSMGTISTIAFGVGLAGVAVGVVGLMNPSSAEPLPPAKTGTFRWTPVVGLGTAGVSGQF